MEPPEHYQADSNMSADSPHSCGPGCSSPHVFKRGARL